MSYSAPGPRRDHREARSDPSSAKPPPVGSPSQVWVARPTPHSDRSVGEGEPMLDHLMRVNEERLAALHEENEQLARSALHEVVADLDSLLDSTMSHVWPSRSSRTRKHVKKIVKQDLAVSTAAALPLGEVADLLDMRREQVDAVLRILRKQGAVDAGTRDAALREISQLRGQLRLVEATEDHNLLDRLMGFLVGIAQALAIAGAATVTGTLAIGEHLVDTLVVKAAIIGLVTKALVSAMIAIRDRRHRRDPYTIARDSLADLIAELATFSSGVGTEAAYELQWPVGRIRLLVKSYKTQQAMLEITWGNKALCWNALSELALLVGHSPNIHAAEFGELLHKLRAVQGQVPKG